MAEETQKTEAAPETVTGEVVAVSDIPEAEKPSVVRKEARPSAREPETDVAAEEEKITESTSFNELPDPKKKALDELKQLVREGLNKHEFTDSPPTKVEEKPADESPAAEVTEKEETSPAPATKEEKTDLPAETLTAPPAVVVKNLKSEPDADAVEESEPVVVSEVLEKVTVVVDEDGAKTVEAIEETIIAVSAPVPPPEESAPVEESKKESDSVPPPPPEEVSIWGIPLLADIRSDIILLKFLIARDFKVKEAFTMLKNAVKWRKDFRIESLLEEDLGNELDKVVFMEGFDKEGHPICYNVYGEFNSKELYQNTFSDEERRQRFLRWRIQFLEKSIRKLDFSPDGICSFVQINDLKNSPGPFKRELRMATNQALHLLQDNYPEFLAKQVFVNVPWWYLAAYRMVSPFLTQRTKSKFVFASPSKSAETLFKYISPEQVPVQYGGVSREGEFTTADAVTEEIIKPFTKNTVEFPVSEAWTSVWEVRVVGWEVSYGAEFVPVEGYTVIIQKPRKITASEETVISDSFKASEAGKLLVTFDNQTSKKKMLLFRSKTKPSD